MHHSMKVCLTALALVSPFSGLIGCAPTEPTQIVAGMVTQMRVPEEIRSVGLMVMSGGRLITCRNYQVDGESGVVHLPSTYATSSEGEYTRPLTITVLGFPENSDRFEQECIVDPQVGEGPTPPQIMRRRSSTFIANEALFLPMPLRHSCDGVKCTGNTTCIAGRCVAEIEMPSDNLPVFDPARSTGADGTCFDINQCANEKLPTTLKPTLVNPNTCEFALDIPQEVHALLPANAGINVVVHHDNLTPEILDLDAEEGFVVPADSNGLAQFRLSPGLCESRYKKGLLTNIQATIACPSKPPTQAMCIDQQRQLIAGKVDSLLPQTPLPRGKIELKSELRSTLVLIDHKELNEALSNFAYNKGLVKESSSATRDPEKVRSPFGSALLAVLDSPLLTGSRVSLAPADVHNFGVLGMLTVPVSHDQRKLQEKLREAWAERKTQQMLNDCLPSEAIMNLFNENKNNNDNAASKSLIIISDSVDPMNRGSDSKLTSCANNNNLQNSMTRLYRESVNVRVVVDVSNETYASDSTTVEQNWNRALFGNSDHDNDDDDDDMAQMKIFTSVQGSSKSTRKWFEDMIASVMGESCRFRLPEAWRTWSDEEKRAARIVASRRVLTEEGEDTSTLSYGLCSPQQDSDNKTDCFTVVDGKFIELLGNACTYLHLNAMWPSIQANLTRTQSKDLPYSNPYLVQLVP